MPTTLLCCSDVIESTIGKFKYKLNANSVGGMTEFALAIASFGTTFTHNEILQAMEASKCKDLKDWKNKNNVQSLAKKKQDIFNKKPNEKINNC